MDGNSMKSEVYNHSLPGFLQHSACLPFCLLFLAVLRIAGFKYPPPSLVCSVAAPTAPFQKPRWGVATQ